MDNVFLFSNLDAEGSSLIGFLPLLTPLGAIYYYDSAKITMHYTIY